MNAPQWNFVSYKEETYYYKLGTFRSNNIVVFDFLDCLVWPECGWIPYTEHAYSMIETSPDVPGKLRELENEGWTLVIISSSYDGRAPIRKDQIDYLCRNAKITPFVCVSDDISTTPLWDRLLARMNLKPEQISPSSFYCTGFTDEEFDISDSLTGLATYHYTQIFTAKFPTPPLLQPNTIIIAVAANEVCFRDYLNELKAEGVIFTDNPRTPANDRILFLYPDNRNAEYDTRNYLAKIHPNTNFVIYWFAIPPSDLPSVIEIDRYCFLFNRPGVLPEIGPVYRIN